MTRVDSAPDDDGNDSQPGGRIVLHRIAELVPVNDERRPLLENIDKIAQGACDLHRAYVSGKGVLQLVHQPEFHTALKAQVAAAAMLNPKILGDGKKSVNPLIEAIEHAARVTVEAERAKLNGENGRMDS